MKKAILLAVTTVLIAMLSIAGCSNGSGGSGGNGGSGGSGADFDASLYYTKNNIDHYIQDSMPRFLFGGGAVIAAANTTWLTGVALPSSWLGGAQSAIVSLSYHHSGAAGPEELAIKCGVGDTSDKHNYILLNNLHDNESRTVTVTLDNDGTWDPTQMKWMSYMFPSGATINIDSYVVFYDSSKKKP
jgi:hypothetical protein